MDLKRLGANLRTARLARNLSLEHVAAQLGVGRRAVATAEGGKPGTAIGVYWGLLWMYGLLAQAVPLADPGSDEVVRRNIAARRRAHPSRKGDLDNDF